MKSSNLLPRRRLLGALAVSGASLAMPVARGAETVRWKMVTSWPKNSPGPGITAQRLADRISQMSGGRLQIKLYAAGELVPALEVLDGVGGGAADIGHTAALFWQGKMPAAAFFTAVPFGLTPLEHQAWIYHGGGQALWDELYAPFGVKPMMAGNTGMSMGGWFKREITRLDDIKGLKYRIPGLGGEILQRLGGVPVSIAPGDIMPSLQSGVVDGAEFAGPWSDLAFGFYKVAPYYYWPGFHEPNGTGECLLNLQSWQSLPADLQQVVSNACVAENAFSVAEAELQNARSLALMVEQHGVKVRAFPADVLNAARQTAAAVMAEFAARGDLEKRIYESFEAVRRGAIEYARVSSLAFLQARAD